MSGDCIFLLFPSLLCGLMAGVIWGTHIEIEGTIVDIQKTGRSKLKKGLRVVGVIEQRIQGFKDKWEAIGNETED